LAGAACVLRSPEKVTGRAVFTNDVYLPGMLYVKMSISYAHARIKKMDSSQAEALPGVWQSSAMTIRTSISAILIAHAGLDLDVVARVNSTGHG